MGQIEPSRMKEDGCDKLFFKFGQFVPLPARNMDMKNLRYLFPTCYAYSVKEPMRELNLERALYEDTGVFSSFFSLLSSSSPLGQTSVSGNSTLHQ